MVNTEITLIIFFAAKDREALYTQQKQDLELTVAQIISSLLQHSYLNWRKQGKTRPKSNPLLLYRRGDESVQGIGLVESVSEELQTEAHNI